MNKSIKLNILTMVAFVLSFGLACWGEELTFLSGLVNVFHALLFTISISLAYFIFFMTDFAFRNAIYATLVEKNPSKMKDIEWADFAKIYEMVIFLGKVISLIFIAISLVAVGG